jgi:hypothetical protein
MVTAPAFETVVPAFPVVSEKFEIECAAAP